MYLTTLLPYTRLKGSRTCLEVLVCSNGLIVNSKDVAIVRKHTGTIKEELEEKINDGVNKLGLLFDKITSIRDKLKNIPLTKREMSEYAGRMFIEDNVLKYITSLNVILFF